MSEHLNKIFELEGFVTLEQLNEHAKCLSVKAYKAWYQHLDVASLLKLVISLSQVADRREVVETLANRMELKQMEMEDWKHRYLSLISKITKEESEPLLDSDPF